MGAPPEYADQGCCRNSQKGQAAVDRGGRNRLPETASWPHQILVQ